MIQAGQLITDGTAIMIIDDIRDGARVGDIILRHTLRHGYIKANGAVVAASDYPRLLQYVLENKLTITEDDWQSGQYDKYVYNNDAGTLRVPNMVGRVMQGGDSVASVEAGLPNITGTLSEIIGTTNSTTYGTGAFSGSGASSPGAIAGPASKNYDRHAVFDASRCSSIYGNSNTVQPPAIKLVAQIKY